MIKRLQFCAKSISCSTEKQKEHALVVDRIQNKEELKYSLAQIK